MAKRSSRRTCEICGAKEAHLKNPRFFANFPLEEKRCKEWVRATGNEDLVLLPIEKLNSIKHVCLEHFKKTHINKKKSRLKKRAIPCLNLKCAPLTDDQMSDFPLHLLKNQESTAKDGGSSVEKTASPHLVLQPQEIHVSLSRDITSTSKEGQGGGNDKAPRPDIELQKIHDYEPMDEESTRKDRQGSSVEKTASPHLVLQPQEIHASLSRDITSTSKEGQGVGNDKAPRPDIELQKINGNVTLAAENISITTMCEEDFLKLPKEEEVGHDFSLLKDCLKMKWKNMRDMYMKETKKYGRPEKYPGKWRHYRRLTFLNKLLNTKTSDDSENDKEVVVKQEAIDVEVDDMNTDDQEELVVYYNDNEFEDPLPDKQETAPTDDEYDVMFLKSLAPYFKQLDPMRKLVVRSKMQDMLLNEIAAQTSSQQLHLKKS